MSKTFSREVLQKWLNTAVDTNVTFHNNRTRLYDQLVAISKLQADENKDNCTVSLSTFLKLKQFLTARNETIQKNDNLQLAYQKTIEELAKELEERSDDADASSLSSQLVPEQKADNTEEV
jgi:hypothetical protein